MNSLPFFSNFSKYLWNFILKNCNLSLKFLSKRSIFRKCSIHDLVEEKGVKLKDKITPDVHDSYTDRKMDTVNLN